VLRDNYLQSQALSVVEAMGWRQLDQQGRFMRALERAGKIDRGLEFLPDDETLQRRLAARRGLTRPELAVLLALPGFRAKLRYGLGLLFPAPDFMRIQHGLTGKIQLGSAYVRRFVRVSSQGLKVLTQLLLGPLLPS
jgi:hypothetical protein